jgi:hypothetical protein
VWCVGVCGVEYVECVMGECVFCGGEGGEVGECGDESLCVFVGVDLEYVACFVAGGFPLAQPHEYESVYEDAVVSLEPPAELLTDYAGEFLARGQEYGAPPVSEEFQHARHQFVGTCGQSEYV